MSCHYTLFIPWKTHSFAASLYYIKSLVVHYWGRIGHFSRCSIVCLCSPQSHMVSASLYFYFTMFDLQRPTSILSLFRHFQCNHEASVHVPRSSDGMDVSFCGIDRRWSMLLVLLLQFFLSSGVTEWLHAFVYRLVTV